MVKSRWVQAFCFQLQSFPEDAGWAQHHSRVFFLGWPEGPLGHLGLE